MHLLFVFQDKTLTNLLLQLDSRLTLSLSFSSFYQVLFPIPVAAFVFIVWIFHFLLMLQFHFL
jgi:hypothetical protein